MARRNGNEVLYLKLKATVKSFTDIAEADRFLQDDTVLLRRLFPQRAGAIKPLLEIWILPGSGRLARYEVLPDRIREVSHD
jgi:hypothetical protein